MDAANADNQVYLQFSYKYKFPWKANKNLIEKHWRKEEIKDKIRARYVSKQYTSMQRKRKKNIRKEQRQKDREGTKG